MWQCFYLQRPCPQLIFSYVAMFRVFPLDFFPVYFFIGKMFTSFFFFFFTCVNLIRFHLMAYSWWEAILTVVFNFTFLHVGHFDYKHGVWHVDSSYYLYNQAWKAPDVTAPLCPFGKQANHQSSTQLDPLSHCHLCHPVDCLKWKTWKQTSVQTGF